MALPKDYAGQRCSLSRALEGVGERWTLLIMRDAFFGVRRFGDFAAHLGVPRAVLTERLESLREAGVLAETRGSHGYSEYVLTDKGLSLWPVVRDLLNEHSPGCFRDLLCLRVGRQRRHRFLRSGGGQEFARIKLGSDHLLEHEVVIEV